MLTRSATRARACTVFPWMSSTQPAAKAAIQTAVRLRPKGREFASPHLLRASLRHISIGSHQSVPYPRASSVARTGSMRWNQFTQPVPRGRFVAHKLHWAACVGLNCDERTVVRKECDGATKRRRMASDERVAGCRKQHEVQQGDAQRPDRDHGICNPLSARVVLGVASRREVVVQKASRAAGAVFVHDHVAQERFEDEHRGAWNQDERGIENKRQRALQPGPHGTIGASRSDESKALVQTIFCEFVADKADSCSEHEANGPARADDQTVSVRTSGKMDPDRRREFLRPWAKQQGFGHQRRTGKCRV
eukprot:5428294-Prymnesium_polylepis.6